jgi:hypothetical protein
MDTQTLGGILMKNALRKRVTVCLLTCFLSLGIIASAYADDANVLPKGTTSLQIEGKFYLPVTERFDADGHVEDVATDYNANLNGNIFPALGQLESVLGLPPGSASLGRSEVSFEYNFTIVDYYVFHGVTDRLTVGVKIPYWWVKNNVTSNLNTSNATVGKNAALNSIVPLEVPGTVPLTTQDVKDLLGPGLDIDGDGKIDIPGFGYKKFKSFSNNGVGDIEAGFRYQYFKNENWRLAFTAGARFPTGDKTDPDSLVDYPIGSGAYGLLFRLHNDYTGVKNLVLDATFRYDHSLPFTDTRRIQPSVHEPITDIKDEVKIYLGDIIELEASGTYTFAKGVSAVALYKYGFSLKDKVKNSSGEHITSLEDETDYTEHVFKTALTYSTIPLFMEKKFPVPLDAYLEYRNRFAGSNNIFKSQYIALGLVVYFDVEKIFAPSTIRTR